MLLLIFFLVFSVFFVKRERERESPALLRAREIERDRKKQKARERQVKRGREQKGDEASRRGRKKKNTFSFSAPRGFFFSHSFFFFFRGSAEPRFIRGARSAPMTAAVSARVSARRRRGGVGTGGARGASSTMRFAAIAMATTLITRASAFYLPGVAPQDFAMVRPVERPESPREVEGGRNKSGKEREREERRHCFFLRQARLLSPSLDLVPSLSLNFSHPSLSHPHSTQFTTQNPTPQNRETPSP